MPPYEKHIFTCTNQRAEGHHRGCCQDKGGMEVRVALAQGLAARGLKGVVRANKSGCLDACELGVAVVVYPQGVWYLGVTSEDADEIIETSIMGDGIVERLAARPKDWEHLRSLRAADKPAAS